MLAQKVAELLHRHLPRAQPRLRVLKHCHLLYHLSAPTAESATASTVAEQAPASCGAGLRLFMHQLLMNAPLCIPTTPRHVIALDMASLELLLLTSQKPVATADWILDELPLLLLLANLVIDDLFTHLTDPSATTPVLVGR